MGGVDASADNERDGDEFTLFVVQRSAIDGAARQPCGGWRVRLDGVAPAGDAIPNTSTPSMTFKLQPTHNYLIPPTTHISAAKLLPPLSFVADARCSRGSTPLPDSTHCS